MRISFPVLLGLPAVALFIGCSGEAERPTEAIAEAVAPDPASEAADEGEDPEELPAPAPAEAEGEEPAERTGRGYGRPADYPACERTEDCRLIRGPCGSVVSAHVSVAEEEARRYEALGARATCGRVERLGPRRPVCHAGRCEHEPAE